MVIMMIIILLYNDIDDDDDDDVVVVVSDYDDYDDGYEREGVKRMWRWPILRPNQ